MADLRGQMAITENVTIYMYIQLSHITMRGGECCPGQYTVDRARVEGLVDTGSRKATTSI